MAQKNVLVVGGAGYIGSHTVLGLQAEGFTPVVYDNFSSGRRDALFADHWVEGALSDRDALRDALQRYEIGSVIHFAALIEAGVSVREPLSFYRNNVASTVSLLEAMAEAGVHKLVFSSTAAVYGNQDGDGALHEGLPMQPTNPYGQTKAAVERMLRDVTDATPLQAIALRYFNAAGADPEGRTGERHEPETHLIPLVLEAAAGLRPQITIYGTDYPTPDGTCVRDYVHVSDLARGHVTALKHLLADDQPDGHFTPVNLGSGQGYSVQEVIQAAETVTGRRFPVVLGDRREGDPSVLVSDPACAANLLGWQTQRSELHNIVRDAWHFMQKQGVVSA